MFFVDKLFQVDLIPFYLLKDFTKNIIQGVYKKPVILFY